MLGFIWRFVFIRHLLLLNRKVTASFSDALPLNRLNLDLHVRLVVDLQNGNVQGRAVESLPRAGSGAS